MVRKLMQLPFDLHCRLLGMLFRARLYGSMTTFRMYQNITSGRKMSSTVAVAMSGGIDSAATAMLLKDAGYNCIGVHMKNWDERDECGTELCPKERDFEDMKEVCDRLQIPAFQVDLSKKYWNYVFAPFLESYRSGCETPNPDVFCNRFVKFLHFKELVGKRFKTDYLATGHYARLNSQPCTSHITTTPATTTNIGTHKLGSNLGRDHRDTAAAATLLRGIDSTKDQSYFLCMVPGTSFANVLFPLGGYTKESVRSMVKDRLHGCRVLKRKESMGICFVGKRAMPSFLSEYFRLTAGRFVDLDTNKVLGSHNGSEAFTVGQKANIGGVEHKYYVARKLSNASAMSASICDSGGGGGGCGQITSNDDAALTASSTNSSSIGISSSSISSSSSGSISSSSSSSSSTVYVVRGTNHPYLFSRGCAVPASKISWVAGVDNLPEALRATERVSAAAHHVVRLPQRYMGSLLTSPVDSKLHPEAEVSFTAACEEYENRFKINVEEGNPSATAAAWFPCSFKIRHGQQTSRCWARLLWCQSSVDDVDAITTDKMDIVDSNSSNSSSSRRANINGSDADNNCSVSNSSAGNLRGDMGAHTHTSADVGRNCLSGNGDDVHRMLYLRVLFHEPQRALSPGQILALYDGDVCLGGVVL